MRLAYELLRRSHGLAVDLENYISLSQARILRRASRTNALHGNAIHVRRNMQLLPHIRSKLSDCQPQLALLRSRSSAIARNFCILVILADLHAQRLRSFHCG